MTRTDRGAVRRRLLEAVRSDADGETSSDDVESSGPGKDRPEPAPDGGIVALTAPLFHCSVCDRTYIEEPVVCTGCGESSFEQRTHE